MTLPRNDVSLAPASTAWPREAALGAPCDDPDCAPCNARSLARVRASLYAALRARKAAP